jgi:hypothetical protein
MSWLLKKEDMMSRGMEIGRVFLSCVALPLAFLGCSGSKPAPAVSNPEPAAAAIELKPVEEFAERLRDARKRAAESGMPAGVSLLIDPDNPFFADRCLLVKASESFSKGWLVGEKGQKVAVGHDGDKPLVFDDVEVGDLLELKEEEGRVYCIEKITSNRLEVAEALRFALKASPKEPNFEIHRQHRPIADAKPFALGTGWIIDMTPSGPNSKGLTKHEGNTVLFAPDGTLLAAQPSSVLLWMRHVSTPAESKLEALIRISRTTGMVTVHPVNRDPNTGNGDPLYHANK